MSHSIKGATQVYEQSVWLLRAYLSEKSSLEISIRGRIDRFLTLTQCEFIVYTQYNVLLKYVTDPNVG